MSASPRSDPGSTGHPEVRTKPVVYSRDAGSRPSQRTGPSTCATTSATTSATSCGDEANILSRLDLEHVTGAEARRRIRQHNRDYFHTRIWDPALQQDFIGAYRLAHNGNESTSAEGRGAAEIGQKGEAKADKKLRAVAGIQPKVTEEGESEWGQSVRLALAKLENRIANEDPRSFVKARRESADMHAWMRTSKARLSALATGSAMPNSPFEEAFVVELLRENEEIALKHSSTPLAEAERLFLSDSRSSTQLPHYTLRAKYPLVTLTPKDEIQEEMTQVQMTTRDTNDRPFTVFEERKEARRAGRAYKSSSQYTYLDMHGCLGLEGFKFWKRIFSKKQ